MFLVKVLLRHLLLPRFGAKRTETAELVAAAILPIPRKLADFGVQSAGKTP